MVVQRFGFPILFWSRTQSTVALSSAEAELAAMVAGIVDAKLVQSLLQELGEKVRLVLYSDSTAAIGHTQRQGLGRMRHLQVKDLWLQQEIQEQTIQVSYIPSRKNPADLFTKPMDAQRFQELRQMLGVTVAESDHDKEEREVAVTGWLNQLE